MKEEEMKKTMSVLIGLTTLLMLTVVPAFAVDNIVDTVLNGCKQELSTYCKDVTPGQGRLLACLYAHEDKLSGRCDYALYDASAQLERMVSALSYVANECRDDLQSYCSNVRPGQGRLLDCMEKHDKKLSKRCKQAMEDIGLGKASSR